MREGLRKNLGKAALVAFLVVVAWIWGRIRHLDVYWVTVSSVILLGIGVTSIVVWHNANSAARERVVGAGLVLWFLGFAWAFPLAIEHPALVKQLTDTTAVAGQLRARSATLRETIIMDRDTISTLREQIGGRTQRRAIVVEATKLRQEGNALFTECCRSPIYPPPQPLLSRITAWRGRVQGFVRRVSNPAFKSERYEDQPGEPQPSRYCPDTVNSQLLGIMWEIEQDVGALQRVSPQ
jgi:hypothetical protein